MPTVTSENLADFIKQELNKKNAKPNYDEMTSDFSETNDPEYIKHHAEKFAKHLTEQGFQTDVQHSGSKAGASSYVNVYDPQTGRFIKDPIRFSGHSKGAFGTTLVHNVLNPTEIDHYIKAAHEMRALGPSEHLKPTKEQEERIAKLRAKNEAKKQKQLTKKKDK